MKITKFRQLDETVARALGYRYFREGDRFLSYAMGWIPPEITEDEKAEWLEFNDGDLPEFSTDYRAMRRVIDFFKAENLVVEINTNYDITVVQVKERPYWRAYDSEKYSLYVLCGKGYGSSEADYSENSLPIAICLSLLKYKEIEFSLELSTEDE